MTTQSVCPINLLIVGACLFIIMFGIQATAVIINPILLAVIITIAVLPLPTKLRQRSMSGRVALLLTVLSVEGVMLAVILLFVGGIYQLTKELTSYKVFGMVKPRMAGLWHTLLLPQVVPMISRRLIVVFTTVLVGTGRDVSGRWWRLLPVLC